MISSTGASSLFLPGFENLGASLRPAAIDRIPARPPFTSMARVSPSGCKMISDQASYGFNSLHTCRFGVVTQASVKLLDLFSVDDAMPIHEVTSVGFPAERPAPVIPVPP